jgi:phage tail tape-measure protein
MGTVAGGALGAYATKNVRGAVTGAQLGNKAQDWLIKNRDKNKTVDEKIEDVAEAGSPEQQAAIAISKKEKQTDEDQRLDPHCWKGYRKAGTKMKGGTRVNNCVPVREDIERIMAGYIKILASK